jgi:hypothetical protein
MPTAGVQGASRRKVGNLGDQMRVGWTASVSGLDERRGRPFRGMVQAELVVRRLILAPLALLALGAMLMPRAVRAEAVGWPVEWTKALALYKNKEYRAACPLFKSAAAHQPRNGAIWGDLGLCLLKLETLGSRDASIHASRLAVRFGDERVRKNAYFNLNLAGVKESLPDDGCTTVAAPPEAECKKSAAVCVKSWGSTGRVFQTSGKVAFFARSALDAERERDRLNDIDPTPDMIAGGVSLAKASDNSCSSWCDFYAWDAVEPSMFKEQALACLEKRRGPFPSKPDPCVQKGKRCTDFLDCVQAVLSHVRDSRPIARESDRVRASCRAECEAGADSDSSECSVVHVDACSARVGVVCTTLTPDTGRVAVVASEFEIPPPDAVPQIQPP